MFLSELCDLLDVARPDPRVEDQSQNAYVFERMVPARRLEGPTTANFIDLYKRGCFVLEAKQSKKRLQQLDLKLPEPIVGSGKRGSKQWDNLMLNAREQAEGYAKRLPAEEGWPPFLMVVDIGHVIELWADFSLQGKHYAHFPDRQSYRIYLDELRDPKVRERLRTIWTDPQSLDPAKRTAAVTREIAELLAKLSKSLETRHFRALPDKLQPERQSHERHAIAEKVALFLMRCLFTMFAEDVGLLKRESFVELLREYQGKAGQIHHALSQLWQQMNLGGFSPILRDDVLRFNGALFKSAEAMEIDEDELGWLIIAAQRDWKDVEPAIFGTLLERALDPVERHRLGAHYTPRAYVERLVVATIIEPLTEDWRDVQAAAAQQVEADDTKGALTVVREFHRKLCETRVLDPACGTGNFLYVSMELMKRLEGEVLESLADLGDDQYLLELDRHTVDPHQFLGLEINPRAVAIAELVLWIGYLQWHFRTRGRTMPAQPVLKNFGNIVEQDAILAYDSWDVLRDDMGRPVTRWDGLTYRLHPITGEEVPDEEARIELRQYLNPRQATWPEADFIVGNPPFIGGKDMRQELGDGYAEACWQARNHIPGGADFVMHFWDKAAEAVRLGGARRFGLITTNSITQRFSRRVVEAHLGAKRPLSLAMAIPNHPWLKSADRAAVRIAMTVGVPGDKAGLLRTLVRENGLSTDTPTLEFAENRGAIQPDLSLGADVTSIAALQSNRGLAHMGVKLHGNGFILTHAEADILRRSLSTEMPRVIRPFVNGRDLAQKSRGVFVIDLFGWTESEVLDDLPQIYHWIVDRVKPKRDENNRKMYRDLWWIWGEPRKEWRHVSKDISRYIATTRTARHRVFQFLSGEVVAESKIVSIASDDAYYLGVLSSRAHIAFALATGGWLGVGNDPTYNHTDCFDPFPFPDPPAPTRVRIRELGERLDAHRKAVLVEHKHLTMTKLYNVLEKVRAEKALNDAERDIYDAGLVGALKQIHDDLDTAVASAYSWSAGIDDEELLVRLVELNHERAAEERQGRVRWLRPDYQAPKPAVAPKKAEQIEAELTVTKGKARKPSLPKALPHQVAAIRALLSEAEAPIAAPDLARRFSQGKRVEKKVEDVLRTLTLLGQAERVNGGYLASR